jgi:nucleolar protein 14
LDLDFSSLRDLIYAPDPSSSGANSIPLGNGSHPRSAVPQLAPEPEDADYDQHVRELVYEKRAKPKDRTKTEEELALEEKETLEKAERQRRKRMLGLDESDSENEAISRRKRKRGGDDLEDDFADTEQNELGVGLGEGVVGLVPDEDEGEDDDDDSDSDPEDGSSEGEAEEEWDSVESGEEGNEGEHRAIVRATGPSKSKDQNMSGKELPFTFPCPSSHEEFLEIVEDIEDEDVPTVVHRIRTLYHTSLAPENKFKLQVCVLCRRWDLNSFVIARH